MFTVSVDTTDDDITTTSQKNMGKQFKFYSEPLGSNIKQMLCHSSV